MMLYPVIELDTRITINVMIEVYATLHPKYTRSYGIPHFQLRSEGGPVRVVLGKVFSHECMTIVICPNSHSPSRIILLDSLYEPESMSLLHMVGVVLAKIKVFIGPNEVKYARECCEIMCLLLVLLSW